VSDLHAPVSALWSVSPQAARLVADDYGLTIRRGAQNRGPCAFDWTLVHCGADVAAGSANSRQNCVSVAHKYVYGGK